MPFTSKAQQRWAFSQSAPKAGFSRSMATEFARETDQKRLPEKKKKKKGKAKLAHHLAEKGGY